MGKRLRLRGLCVDVILSSPALRARQTAIYYALALGYPCEALRFNPSQYAASPQQLLQLIQQVEDVTQCLLMVGHNPETTELTNLLSNARLTNIPTAGMAAISFSRLSWREVGPGKGALVFFDYPKNQPA